MGSCSSSQNILTNPDIIVMDGCYVIPIVSDSGEHGFFKIDPKTRKLKFIRERKKFEQNISNISISPLNESSHTYE
jgi:hypothetical protein